MALIKPESMEKDWDHDSAIDTEASDMYSLTGQENRVRSLSGISLFKDEELMNSVNRGRINKSFIVEETDADGQVGVQL